jgi:hypothetical protein
MGNIIPAKNTEAETDAYKACGPEKRKQSYSICIEMYHHQNAVQYHCIRTVNDLLIMWKSSNIWERH